MCVNLKIRIQSRRGDDMHDTCVYCIVLYLNPYVCEREHIINLSSTWNLDFFLTEIGIWKLGGVVAEKLVSF